MINEDEDAVTGKKCQKMALLALDRRQFSPKKMP